MTLEKYLPSWVLDYLSPGVLLIGGLLAIVIVALYLKDKESAGYKFVMILGAAFGVLIVILAVIEGFKVQAYTLILIAVAAFTLIIRPIREIHIAAIIGLLIMIVAYIALGQLNGAHLGSIDLTVLSTGWPRIIIAFVVGAIVYGLLSFAEALVKMFGKILNWWPLLLVLGLICMVEGVCILLGYGSVFNYVNDIPFDEYLKLPQISYLWY